MPRGHLESLGKTLEKILEKETFASITSTIRKNCGFESMWLCGCHCHYLFGQCQNNGCLSPPIVLLELWREHVHFIDTLRLPASRRTNASTDGAKEWTTKKSESTTPPPPHPPPLPNTSLNWSLNSRCLTCTWSWLLLWLLIHKVTSEAFLFFFGLSHALFWLSCCVSPQTCWSWHWCEVTGWWNGLARSDSCVLTVPRKQAFDKHHLVFVCFILLCLRPAWNYWTSSQVCDPSQALGVFLWGDCTSLLLLNSLVKWTEMLDQ